MNLFESQLSSLYSFLQIKFNNLIHRQKHTRKEKLLNVSQHINYFFKKQNLGKQGHITVSTLLIEFFFFFFNNFLFPFSLKIQQTRKRRNFLYIRKNKT